MTLDSIAESVRKVRFQSVKAKAVLTIASQRTMSQPCKLKTGGGSVIKPAASSKMEPTPILTKVTVSG